MSASSKTFAVVAVADGMGGMNDGAACATRTISSFFNALIRFRQKHPSDRLQLAAECANTEVSEFSNTKGGSTISAVLLTADQGVWTVNVGDSRVYALHQKKNVTRLTVDDSLEEALGGRGRELLQFIGMGLGIAPHVAQVPLDVNRLLVTSDGVHFIAPEILNDILRLTEKREDVVTQLIEYANWRGAPDNASLAVIDTHELISMLPSIEESGIELWNSFSELHVMWLRPNQVEADFRPEAAPNQNDRERFYSPNDKEEFFNRNENAPFFDQRPGQPANTDNSSESESVREPSSDGELSILTTSTSEDLRDKEAKKTSRARPPKSSTGVRKKKPSKTTKRPSTKSKNVQLSIDVETPNE